MERPTRDFLSSGHCCLWTLNGGSRASADATARIEKFFPCHVRDQRGLRYYCNIRSPDNRDFGFAYIEDSSVYCALYGPASDPNIGRKVCVGRQPYKGPRRFRASEAGKCQVLVYENLDGRLPASQSKNDFDLQDAFVQIVSKHPDCVR